MKVGRRGGSGGGGGGDYESEFIPTLHFICCFNEAASPFLCACQEVVTLTFTKTNTKLPFKVGWLLACLLA